MPHDSVLAPASRMRRDSRDRTDRDEVRRNHTPWVFLLDLWCMIPFYERFLYESLRRAGVEVTLGCASYALDPSYFSSAGVTTRPGILDIVAKLRIRNPTIRRMLKLVEYCVNLLAIAV